MNTVTTLVAIAAIPAAGLLWGIRHTMRQGVSLAKEIGESGESILAGPERGLYQTAPGGIVSLKTEGVAALTDKRIIFRPPLGKDIEIPISQIRSLSENQWFQGNYRSGRNYLILDLDNGSQAAFMLKSQETWVLELGGRIGVT